MKLKIITLTLLWGSVILVEAASGPCVTSTPCRCNMANGTVVDLNNVRRERAIDPSWTYDYHPCHNFTIDVCKDVVACMYNTIITSYYTVGLMSEATFVSVGETLAIQYEHELRLFRVELECVNKDYDTFTELNVTKNYLFFRLSSKDVCPVQLPVANSNLQDSVPSKDKKLS